MSKSGKLSYNERLWYVMYSTSHSQYDKVASIFGLNYYPGWLPFVRYMENAHPDIDLVESQITIMMK